MTMTGQRSCYSKVTLILSELFAGFVVGVEGADIETAGGHGPGMHIGVLDHIVGKIAGGILATAVLDTVTYQVEVLL